jgi:ATP-binding cassette subfamily B protein
MADLQRLSEVSGRVRWRVDGLYRDVAAAKHLAEFLGCLPDVLAVRSNPGTGRVLVRYRGPAEVVDRLEVSIREGMALASGGTAAPGVPSRLPSNEICAAAGISVATAAASLARIVFLGRTLDRLMTARAAGTGMAAVGLPAGVAIVAGVAYIRLKKRNSAVWSRLGRDRHHTLRMRVARTLALADLAELDRMSVPGISSTVRGNLADIERGFDGAGELVGIAANTVILSGAFLVLAPGLVWIPLLALVVMAIEARRGHAPIQRAYLAAGEARDHADKELAELVDGLPTVRSFGLERWKLAQVEATARSYGEASAAAAQVAARNPLRLELITLLGVSAVTIAAGFVLAGGGMSTGTHLVLMMTAGHLFYPFSALGSALDSAYRGLAADKALTAVSRIPAETVGIPGVPTAPVPADTAGTRGLDITLDAVDFRYPTGSSFALRKATVHIPAGSFVGLVGASGSGKSTIMKLLLRFYDATGGAIRIDGTDIRRFDRAELRSLFATIDQQSFLFEDTIVSNIVVGQDDADEAAVRVAARAASLSAFVESLPDRYATDVGARGNKLSDGQRQRVLLARALLRPAPVLVLDEATSNIDATTEEAVLSNIRASSAGRTVIVIAHRLAAVRAADTIFVLDGGRVAESGSHDVLVAKEDGRYRSLWESQHRKSIP